MSHVLSTHNFPVKSRHTSLAYSTCKNGFSLTQGNVLTPMFPKAKVTCLSLISLHGTCVHNIVIFFRTLQIENDIKITTGTWHPAPYLDVRESGVSLFVGNQRIRACLTWRGATLLSSCRHVGMHFQVHPPPQKKYQIGWFNVKTPEF